MTSGGKSPTVGVVFVGVMSWAASQGLKGSSLKEFMRWFHQTVKGPGSYSGSQKNPDYQIDPETGDISVKGSNGEDPIGNANDWPGFEMHASVISSQAIENAAAVVFGGIVLLMTRGASALSPRTASWMGGTYGDYTMYRDQM